MTEYIKNPLSGKLRGVTYEDGKIIDVHIRDTDDAVKIFVPVRHGRWIFGKDLPYGMSDEELSWELMLWRCEAVAKYHGVESEYLDTQKTILEWLRQPAKGEENKNEVT